MIRIVTTDMLRRMHGVSDELAKQNQRLIIQNESLVNINRNLLDFNKSLFTRTAFITGAGVAILLILIILMSLNAQKQ